MHFVALKTDVLFFCRLKRLARKWMQALKQGYSDLPVLSGIFTPNTNLFSTTARSLTQMCNIPTLLMGWKNTGRSEELYWKHHHHLFQSYSAWQKTNHSLSIIISVFMYIYIFISNLTIIQHSTYCIFFSKLYKGKLFTFVLNERCSEF